MFLISGQPALHLYRKSPQSVFLVCIKIFYTFVAFYGKICYYWFCFWCQMQRCLCLWQWLSCYCRLSLRIRYLSYIRSVSIFYCLVFFMAAMCPSADIRYVVLFEHTMCLYLPLTHIPVVKFIVFCPLLSIRCRTCRISRLQPYILKYSAVAV